MECRRKSTDKCGCTYGSCSRKNICCECLSYHLRSKELPGCCFPPDAERTYDRSFGHFAELVRSGRI